VPVVSLWFPKQILDDTAAATVPAAGDTRPIASTPYWTLWATSVVLSAAGAIAGLIFESSSTARSLGFAHAVVLTLALIPWIRLVRRISSAQDRLAAVGPVDPAAPTLDR
jgi:hypothetical protein